MNAIDIIRYRKKALLFDISHVYIPKLVSEQLPEVHVTLCLLLSILKCFHVYTT